MKAPSRMKRRDFCTTMVLGTLFALGAVPIAAKSMNGMKMQDAPATPEATVLGTVSFATSCKPEQSAQFNHGVALLHSFWLNAAEDAFAKVATEDPQCAMAYWGIAMADFNQVNGGDRQEEVGKGEVELPAREMLADMWFLGGRFSDALVEYQRSLKSDPNRFNGLLGAAKSAEHVGKEMLAAGLYRRLLSNCPLADGAAAVDLEHARAFLASHSYPSAIDFDRMPFGTFSRNLYA